MKSSPENAPANLYPTELVKPHLEQVEAAIRDQVRGFDPAIEPYVAYVCNTSGKRIRPTLAILTGGATGGVTEDHTKLGVIMELIHMATLVHDDIIDGADTRRMVPTANAKWGNSLSVLLGDALFAHALTLATDFGCIDICRKVGNASREVCQGEIIQTQRRFDLTFTNDFMFVLTEILFRLDKEGCMAGITKSRLQHQIIAKTGFLTDFLQMFVTFYLCERIGN